MSTDFKAIFDVAAGFAGAGWLVSQLAADPPQVAELVERYKEYWAPEAWAIETSHTSPLTGRPEILGPGGFAIDLGPRTLRMYHMMRFSDFTGDDASREALRRACLFVANLVGSPRAIYTNELMPCDGEGIEQVEAGLRELNGPPAATFEELDAASLAGPHSWYIDSFDDLRRL